MRRKYTFLLVTFTGCILLFNSSFMEQVEATNNDTIIKTEPNKAAKKISGHNLPQPKIKFEEKVLDFGKIGPGTKPSGEFRFTNIGNAVLEITKVSQCCGVVTSLDKLKYEPGESGVLKATYNAITRTGIIKRQPIVYSNDPVEPNLILTIKAEIVDKVTRKPDKLKLFLDEENARCPKLTINSTDNQPFSIIDITSTGNCITAQFNPSMKATEFVLDLRVNMENLLQNTKGSVNVIIAHPESKNIITVDFDVVSKFTVNPTLIIIFDATPEESIIRKVWIFTNYNEDFEIESAFSKNNYFKVLSQSKVNNGFQLEVEITSPATGDITKFSDEFYIQIQGGEKLTIDCNGYYKPAKIPKIDKENL